MAYRENHRVTETEGMETERERQSKKSARPSDLLYKYNYGCVVWWQPAYRLEYEYCDGFYELLPTEYDYDNDNDNDDMTMDL